MSEHLKIIDRFGPGLQWMSRALRCGILIACMFGTARTGRAEEPTDPGHASGTANGDMTPSVLLDDLETGAREKQARLLKMRLQLQRLAEESRRARERATPPEVADPVVPPPPAADLEPLLPDLAPSDPFLVPDPPVEEPPLPAEPPGDEHGHTASPPENHAASQPTETVVGASINRLALGDSLFGTGQTELALQAYDNIELTKVATADRYWIEYQIANCHRRLGNIPEAQKRYRKLAGLVDAGWCAGHSRWWLDALATRGELQKNLETVKTSLKSIEEQLNAKPAK
jgi:hypothetical protein